MTEYRSRRLRALHGLPPLQRTSIRPEQWTPDQDPGRLFQPWALTQALDSRDLYDPELSNALDVPVGEVDRWEEGITIPTVEQAKAIAEVTGYPLRFFYQDKPPPQIDGMFICPGGWTEVEQYVSIGRGRWKLERDRPDAYRLNL